jgi:hypothetical protein
MHKSIDNYKKLKKKFIDNYIHNEIIEEQKIIDNKENELNKLKDITIRKNKNQDITDLGKTNIETKDEYYNFNDVPLIENNI